MWCSSRQQSQQVGQLKPRLCPSSLQQAVALKKPFSEAGLSHHVYSITNGRLVKQSIFLRQTRSECDRLSALCTNFQLAAPSTKVCLSARCHLLLVRKTHSKLHLGVYRLITLLRWFHFRLVCQNSHHQELFSTFLKYTRAKCSLFHFLYCLDGTS